ncbi:MAG: penicillin-binding protein 2 [Patescibacteria group bacterium]|nr:penicillin-binding protein 2 [Patescibacteria group bacterium]
MKGDPFKLKIGKPIDTAWEEGAHLDYDQSSVDPRFYHDNTEGERLKVARGAFLFLTFSVLAIFAAQLFRLQIAHYKEYFALAEGNRLRVQYLLAPRGLVLDRYGKNLVLNQPSFELVATPLDLPKDPNLLAQQIQKLCDFFGLDANEVGKLIAQADPNSFYPVTLEQNVPREKAVVFTAEAGAYPGFSIANSPERDYQNSSVYAHILGYTGKLSAGEYEKLKADGYLYNDIVGKEGLEAVYENYLRGTLGQKLVEVDVKGNIQNTFQEKTAEPGNNLNLNLDAELQEVLYDSLVRQLKSHHATRAAAVALDPQTGGVLALVSLPSYDNNLFAQGISHEDYEKLLSDADRPLFNRATSGTYPPGSTVKPALAAAALQEGVITDKTRILDTGKLAVPNQFNPGASQTFRGWNPAGLGEMNVYSAIAMSSDIFFYTVGGGQQALNIAGLGAERVARYLQEFYLGRLTGIDLPTEKPTPLPTPEWKAERYASEPVSAKWYLGDTYNMSIGQGFDLVTPLQLAVYTAALANGGKIYRPELAASVTDRTGGILKTFAPELLAEVAVEKKYMEIVRQGMRQTVTDGTARALATLPLAIAGKTGTSQYDSGDLKNTHAWFISFAPYEQPTIALAVLVELGGEGSGVGVGVAADVYKWYAENRLK